MHGTVLITLLHMHSRIMTILLQLMICHSYTSVTIVTSANSKTVFAAVLQPLTTTAPTAHLVCCDVDLACLISCRCVRSASEWYLHFWLTVDSVLRSSTVSGRVSSWNLSITALTPLSRSTKWNWFQPNRFWVALTSQTPPSKQTHSPTEIELCDGEAILTKIPFCHFFHILLWIRKYGKYPHN